MTNQMTAKELIEELNKKADKGLKLGVMNYTKIISTLDVLLSYFGENGYDLMTVTTVDELIDDLLDFVEQSNRVKNAVEQITALLEEQEFEQDLNEFLTENEQTFTELRD